VRRFVLLAVALAFALAACGGDDEETTPAATPPPATEAGETGTVMTNEGTGEAAPDVSGLLLDDGVLTVGAEFPSPPFLNPPSSNPTGFEVEIANEIAERLGIPEVKWVEVPWTSLFSPAPKNFDFDINETTITEERDEVIDFSDPYFEANQAVLVHQDSEAENVQTLEDVRGLLLGAQEATTGLFYIRETIEPSQDPRVFATTVAANQALLNEQIDAFVIDVPIAAGLIQESPDELVTVGQFVTNEEWGIVFEEGSPLVEPVNWALQQMKDDGTLDALQDEWLPGTTDVPVLE
jgi:polar amino acid transport system substrate-binding protein